MRVTRTAGWLGERTGQRLLGSLASAAAVSFCLVALSSAAGLTYFLLAPELVSRPLGDRMQVALAWLGVFITLGLPALCGAVTFPLWGRLWGGHRALTALLAGAGYAGWTAWALWAISILNECAFGLPFPYEAARDVCSR